jgi:hypothetical protein
LEYINKIRSRAYGGSTAGNFTNADMTLQTILDERSKNYTGKVWRTDLIRYGQLTSSDYLWP